jgi:hypothetical protein
MTACPCGLGAFGFRRCYWHLKRDYLHGQALTDMERIFAVSAPSPPRSAGWVTPDRIPALEGFGVDETGEPFLTDQERRLLAVLSDAPHAYP